MINDGTFADLPSRQQYLKTGAKPVCALYLPSGIEIRSYNLKTAAEATQQSLISRTKSISATVRPYDHSVDLVAEDLRDIPRVLSAINSGNI